MAKDKLSLKDRIGDALYEKISPFIDGTAERIVKTALDVMPGLLANFLNPDVTSVDNPMLKVVPTTVQAWIEGSNMQAEVKKELLKQIASGQDIGILEVLFIMIGNIVGTLLSLTSVASIPAQQSIMEKLLPMLPPPESVINAGIKFPENKVDIQKILKRAGLNDDMQKIMRDSQLPVTPVEVIRLLTLRQNVEGKDLSGELKRYGFTDTQIKDILKSWEVIPPIQDLIVMAVREAFTPEIAGKFGQYEDFPEPLVKWGEAQGLSRDWLERYWAAHWSLPSTLQGFEMLHRDVIDKSELQLLMRALDIMPFWRDKLIQISYNPYTRVDVRRMYKLGVIGEGEVLRTYKDLGYDEEHAKNLTEFVKLYTAEDERELTKSDILNLYKRAVINATEAVDYLKQLNYDDNTISLLLLKADFVKEAKTKTLTISRIRARFMKGLLNEASASEQLDLLNVPASERDLLISEWVIDKESKEPEITLSMLQQLYIANVIDESILYDELRNKGYSARHIEWLIKLTKRKVVVQTSG